MKEELSIPLGVVIRVGAVAVRADMTAEEPALPVPDGRVAILEVHQTCPEGFHLGAAQHEAGLDGLEDLVLMPGPSVGRDRAIASLSGLTCHRWKVLWPRFSGRSGGIGRRARFRVWCPQGCRGSSPRFGTKNDALRSAGARARAASR